MAAPKAFGQIHESTEESAFAVPRVAPRAGGGSAALPQPLAPSEAARLRRLFQLQARGDIAAAVRQSLALDGADAVVEGVLGHLLADRHLGPHTRTAAADLQDWLARWPDLPDAAAIHALLKRRLPAGTAAPALAASALAALTPAAEPVPVPEESEPPGRTLARLPEIDRQVSAAARSGTYGAASRVILAAKGLPPGYAAKLRGEAGQILFALNRDREAYEVAAIGAESCLRARDDSCVTVVGAGYWAGLAAWRSGRIAQAAAMFELAWNADIASSTQRAGAAFWAARAHQRLGDAAAETRWLLRAADEARTFHGLIARRLLRMEPEDDRQPRETLGEADLEAVAAHPGGLRAFALLQIGQRDRAEAELRLLWPAARHAPGLGRALMLVAEAAGMDGLAAQLADIAEMADGRTRERTRFTVPRLRPAGGFTVDPALVYAIARTESNFDPTVVSPAGARGLMQIMPATARFLAGMDDDSPGLPPLHDPAVNLSLGQRYLAFLAGTEVVAGDKIRLLASYNSGPTAMARWSAAVHDHGDPLLFIEAIPIDETRAFVPRVLAHTWLYAARLRLPAPSLDELAAGIWPRYHGNARVVQTLH
ncbi:MAG: lytic transglycosylase domain-containing protein [Acetobacteraceae bacterium]|nr:lytic transglycosylase domain-containing protein [Acetobacteraceae bacterium]